MPVAKAAVKPKTATLRKAGKTRPKKTVKSRPLKTPEKAVIPSQKIAFSPNLKCFFCGKTKKNSKRLIALPAPSNVCICDNCIEVCLKILLDLDTMEWLKRITRIFAIQTEKILLLSEQNKPKTKRRVKKSNAGL